jgi:hypothetical protein
MNCDYSFVPCGAHIHMLHLMPEEFPNQRSLQVLFGTVHSKKIGNWGDALETETALACEDSETAPTFGCGSPFCPCPYLMRPCTGGLHPWQRCSTTITNGEARRWAGLRISPIIPSLLLSSLTTSLYLSLVCGDRNHRTIFLKWKTSPAVMFSPFFSFPNFISFCSS